jgi:hypothetical protein
MPLRIKNRKLMKVGDHRLVRDVFMLWLEELRSRCLLSLDEQELRAKASNSILLRREPAGTEVWLDTLTDNSTFRQLHGAVRKILKLPTRPTNVSVAVYFLSKHPLAVHRREKPEWEKNIVIQCNDLKCRRRLLGMILGVQIHK